MGWIGPVIGAAGSLLGGMMGQQNISATNAMNMAITKQTEDWETTMSNTAMQRRKADLEASGFNPLLAIGQGGASTPGISPIPMQSGNPMGQGVANAAQAVMQKAAYENTQADTRSKNANAAVTEANTPDDPTLTRYIATQMASEGMQQKMQQTGINQLSMQELRNQINNLGFAGEKLKAEIDNLTAANPGITANSTLSQMDAGLRNQIQAAMIAAALQEQRARGSSAGAIADFNQSIWGRMVNAVGGSPEGTGKVLQSGADVIRSVGGLFKPGVTINKSIYPGR